MKTTIIAFLLGAAVVGGIAYNYGWLTNSIEVANEVEERVIDNTPSWAEDEDAVAAAEAVLRKKELEARLEVLQLEIKERQDEAGTIEKELGTY